MTTVYILYSYSEEIMYLEDIIVQGDIISQTQQYCAFLPKYLLGALKGSFSVLI